MPMRSGRGIHDGGFRLYPRSSHSAAHGTGGNTDMRITAYPFHFPSIRERVDIQNSLVFSKPDWSLDRCPIPFDTLQVEIFVVRKEGQVWDLHGNAFMVDAVSMWACTIVPGSDTIRAS